MEDPQANLTVQSVNGGRHEDDKTAMVASPSSSSASDKKAPARKTVSWFINEYRTSVYIVVGILWICFGVVMFQAFEDCLALTALYLMAQIVTTIGYGDVVPTTNGGRLFITFYAFGTILYLGSLIDLLISRIKSQVSSTTQSAWEEHLDQSPDFKHRVWKRLGLWKSTVQSLLWFAIFLVAGTVFYATYERCTCSYGIDLIAGCKDTSFEVCSATGGDVKTWVDSFYMCVITLATIGFGDFTPMTYLGRLLFIPWALLGCGYMATFVTNFGSSLSKTFTAPVPRKPKEAIANELVALMGHKKPLNQVEFSWFYLQQYGFIQDSCAEMAATAFKEMVTSNKQTITVEEALTYVKGHLQMFEEA